MSRSVAAALLLAVGGCGSGAPSPERVFSPPPGSVVADSPIPLGAILLEGDPVRVMLDGAELADPLTISRPHMAGQIHVIGLLDLGGMAKGEHTVAVSAGGSRAEARFTWAPHPCRVQLTAVDGSGRPRAARVLVYETDGRPRPLWGPGGHSDPQGRDERMNTVFLPEGHADLRLPEGRFGLVGAVGLRDAVQRHDVDACAEPEVRFTLPRVVDTPGIVAADLHVHTGRSRDSAIPDRVRFESLAAGGVDVAVLTDHLSRTGATAQRSLLELAADLRVVPGVEIRWERGHVNAFPLEGVGPASFQVEPGGRLAVVDGQEGVDTPAGVERPLLQVNHPRGIQFEADQALRADAHALFNALPFDPAQPTEGWPASALVRIDATTGDRRLADLDAIEVLNRFSADSWRLVRADWFALMNHGVFWTGTGNSDSHSAQVELAGFPVNLVSVDPFEVGAFTEAVRGGRVVVSTGPVIDMEASSSEGAVGPGGALASAGGRVTVTARVRAAGWVPVAEVRLVVDGVVVATESAAEGRDGVLDRTWTWVIDNPDVHWLIVEAGWPLDGGDGPVGGLYGLVAPGYVPIAFTNPVRLVGAR